MRSSVWILGLAALAFWLAGHAALSRAAESGVFVEVKASSGSSVERYRLYGASHALVIGIDNYANGWPRLSNAIKDAREVAKAMEARGFEVELLIDPTGDALRRKLRQFFAIKGADPEARLFVWYAGHGYTWKGEGYLVPADAPSPENPQFLFTALHMGDVGSMVRIAAAKHTFAVFDSCFAGTVFANARAKPPTAITKAAVRPVRQFLTSGDADQEVSDDGSFRKLFLAALEGEEAADLNGDGYLTGTELGFYLEDRVLNLTQGAQTPRSGKLRDQRFDRGDFIFLLPDTDSGTTVSAPAAEPSDKTLDLAFWQSIQNSDNPADYEAYLAAHPDGNFVQLARNRIGAPATPGSQAEPAVGSYAAPKQPGDLFRDCADCPEMVMMPQGSFMMGSPSGEADRDDDEGPQRRVTIGYDLAVGKYEVTRGQYAAFTAATGYASGNSCWTNEEGDWEDRSDRNWQTAGFIQGDGHPVVCVSWEDAKAYVSWLGDHTGKGYRLLSEAEWEYVARAGTTEAYSTGSRISSSQANFKKNNGKTTPVGSYDANGFGLHDVTGNVWEWTEDCWNDGYGGAANDGAARTGGNCGNRPLRGGSWVNKPRDLRVANRFKKPGDYRYDFNGFRVARTLP